MKPASYDVAKQVHTGFLAQDVERIAMELDYQFDGLHTPVNDRDHYSLAYSQFIMPLVKAVQELNTKVETLERGNQLFKINKNGHRGQMVSKQQNIIEIQQREIDELKARLDKLEKSTAR